MEETATKRLNYNDKICFDTLGRRDDWRLKKIQRVLFVSCGTAYHAGIVGKYLIEETTRIPSAAQVSSEFRYSDPILSKRDMVVLITQSGETADTLAALREAKSKGAFTLAIVNVVGSTIAREADAVIYTHAGSEIGVASTKAYTAQLLTLTLFAVYLGQLRRSLKIDRKIFAKEIRKIPEYCKQILKQNKAVEKCARRHFRCGHFLYLGRGYNFATALEGALKLKEISYAHAHGYAAGEMKHGPIALIDSQQPVICIAPYDAKTYEKMISNIQEIKARKGIIISVGTRGDRPLKKISSSFFEIPKTLEMLTPILAAIPLQLLAYRISVLNGRDVDQPRNLAKSVTVE